MSVSAVIFDLDGTLLDTLTDLADATNAALGALGRQTLGIDVVRRFVGNGVPKLIERALAYTDALRDGADGCDVIDGIVAGGYGDGVSGDFDACMKIFTDYYDKHGADNTRPYVGIPELLHSLKARGVKTAIVTNKYDGAAQKLKARFFGAVDVAVGLKDGIRPKPSTDGTELALKLIGADKRTAVYVGDGETDIATAKACGLPVIAVCWGFRSRGVLESLCPDHIVSEPTELALLLERL